MKKRRLKKKTIILFIALILIIGGVVGTFFYLKYEKEEKLRKQEEESLALIEKIKSHYNEFVKVDNDTSLYDEKGSEIGIIYQNMELTLDQDKIDENTKYFKVHDMGYVKYEDVSKIDELSEKDTRFKNYIPFNKNVVTKDSYTLYHADGSKAYTFKESKEFPIVINNYEDRYYVNYEDELMYIVKDDVKETKNSTNSSKKNASKALTLLYHRVYDTNEKCTDVYICKKKSSFDQEMKYLKDNHYFTLKMEEMYLFLTNKIQVEKPILLTFDDGYLWKSVIDVLEKYDLYGSGFIITGRFTDYSVYESKNFELHSHTNAMHTAGVCKMGLQGGGILCKSESDVLADLGKSREILKDPIALSFPFYDYNDRAVNLVKKAGFKMSFIGAAGKGGKASVNSNLYTIPRMTIWDSTSFSKWKSYL